MSLENSGSHQEKETGINRSNEIITKLAATQNVIKNKFSKAYANRLEHENNLNQAMQPLFIELVNDTTPLSITKQSRPMTSTKVVDNKNCNREAGFNNPNELCDRLRILLSAVIVGDVKHVEEMNAIIMKLHELEILL